MRLLFSIPVWIVSTSPKSQSITNVFTWLSQPTIMCRERIDNRKGILGITLQIEG